MFNDEIEDIASASASEAIIELILGIYLEGRGLLLMKWTEPDMAISRAAQRDHPANHIDNVHCLFHKSGNTGNSHLQQACIMEGK